MALKFLFFYCALQCTLLGSNTSLLAYSEAKYENTVTTSLLQSAEVVTAICRISAVGARSKGAFIDLLRIINSLLFLINKNQCSAKSLKAGAYYSEVWLIYDMCHLIKNITRRKKSNKKVVVSGGRENELKKINNILCTHILPMVEAAIATYLALNNDDSTEAKKTRLCAQSLYSLTRAMPIYLQEKNKLIDALFFTHAIMTIADFLRNFLPQQPSNNFGLPETEGQPSNSFNTPQSPRGLDNNESEDEPGLQQPLSNNDGEGNIPNNDYQIDHELVAPCACYNHRIRREIARNRSECEAFLRGAHLIQ